MSLLLALLSGFLTALCFPEFSFPFLSWHGQSASSQQHFLIGVFRAVENRRYFLRAATTGINGIVDPCSRVLARTELMTETFLSGRIIPIQGLSFCARYGDIRPLPELDFKRSLFYPGLDQELS